MYEHVEKPKENTTPIGRQESRAVANSITQKKRNMGQGFGFVDNRHEAVSQRKLQEMSNNNSQAIELVANSLQGNKAVQLQRNHVRVTPFLQMERAVKVNSNGAMDREADMMSAKALQMKSAHTPQSHHFGNNRSEKIIQCMVQVGKKNIMKDILNAAVNKAILEGLVPKEFCGKVDGKPALNKLGKDAVAKLLKKYLSITIFLNDFRSLVNQVSQDLHLFDTENEALVGIPHQHNEYAVNADKRAPGHKINDMRIYRAMPLFAWDEASLWGHGGSLGEAMHYFNVYKKETKRDPSKVYVMVQFTIKGKTIDNMVREIQAGGEGARSDDSKFGGKKESTADFGIINNFFSVDLKHAQKIINHNNVTSKVMASTGDMPDKKNKLGVHWK